jgi:hypothetical protein
MEPFSRRTFLKQTGTGATALGALSALPKLSFARRPRRPAVHASGVARPAGRAQDSSLVVYVPDPDGGQVHLMFGTREVVQHDRALVERLLQAAR